MSEVDIKQELVTQRLNAMELERLREVNETMLAALKWASDYLSSWPAVNPNVKNAHLRGAHDCREAVQSAIAKAEGRISQ